MIFDAIIISDTHLGSELCCTSHLLDFLNKIKSNELKTNLLILNGDVFDSYDFRRLKKSHWKILSVIRKISGHIQIVWVTGNHDGPVDVLNHLLGVEVVEEFTLTSGTKKFLVTHGDRFDEIMSNHPIISKLADRIYQLITKWFPKGFSRLIKRSSKTYSRAINTVRERAISEAISRGMDGTICGHVHMSELTYKGDVVYCNSGSWTESPCTFITVKDGEIKLDRFD